MRASNAILAALAVSAALPAAAGAATLQPLKACYRSVDSKTRESVQVQAGGFTPGAAVDVSIDGIVVTTGVTADQDGNVAGTVTAPYQAQGERPFSLTLTETQRPENAATAQSRIAALDVRLKPQRAKPSSLVHVLGRGFVDGPQIYAHYVRAGKLRKTVSLGAPAGPCGRLDVERRQIPVRRPATGRWTLQVDSQRAYSPRPASVFVRLAITVKRVPRPA
jgi:hypothetical protein